MKKGQAEAAAAKPAATTVVARDQNGKLQILLLQRSAKSRFMAGNYVFPGGLVETADNDDRLWRSHADASPDEIRRRIGDAEIDGKALSAAVAAIRETFEEAGLLLAGRRGLPAGERRTLFSRRLAGELPPDWLRQCVVNDDWIIELSRLLRWSRWITPAQMRYRYDTRFFVARMPEAQVFRPGLKETVHGLWISPEEALGKNLSGKIPLSPPTLVTLHEMLPYAGVRQLESAAAKRLRKDPLKPRLITDGGEKVILEPWDPEYHRSRIRIDAANLRKGVAPVGGKFSRLWFAAGVWIPVTIE